VSSGHAHVSPVAIGTLARVGVLVISLFAVRSGIAADKVPALTGAVNDFANVLDRESEAELERLSRTLQNATADVVVVATVPTIEPYADIREYAVELFENQGRGIGERGKDNGLLVLLALKERRVQIEVGYDLEQWITDGFAGETARDFMVPAFRTGAYGDGLVAGVTRLVARIAEGRNVPLTGVAPPERRRPRRTGVPLSVVIVFFVILVILARIGGGPGRRRRRRGWSGWSSGVGPFGGASWGTGFGRGGFSGGGFGGFGGGGFGGGFGGFGGGRSGGGGGGAGW
jgi:uncharacterized protein